MSEPGLVTRATFRPMDEINIGVYMLCDCLVTKRIFLNQHFYTIYLFSIYLFIIICILWVYLIYAVKRLREL